MSIRTGKLPDPRRGFTLLELLLVLSLLVLIGAMVMPTVRGPLENHRLRKSADLIRAEFAKAKARAMESGRTYVFRYELASGRYRVEPWYSDEDYLESDQLGLSGTGSTAVPPPALASNSESTASSQSLPEDVVFVASETDQQTRELVATSDPNSIQASDGDLSAPIFFYPDGTSSTARLMVKNNRPRYIVLTLRGLTGVVYVSQPLAEEQLQ